jgi:dolichol-phosphate mannosyltransferase
MNKHSLVVIPSYNESENIVSLVTEILSSYPSIDVMVVDDNSPDGTAKILQEELGKWDGRLHVVVRKGKGGRGSAVLEGFRRSLQSDYAFVFEMDADFSHKPEEIQMFLDAAEHCDMVVGSRYLPGSEIHHWGFKRTFFSAWANRYARAVLRIPISDYTNGFRCYSRKAIESLDMDAIDAVGYVVLSEVAYQLHTKGLTIHEVPTIFVNRQRGESNLGFHEIFEAFFSVIRVRSKNFYLHAVQASKFIVCGASGAAIDLGSLYLFVEKVGMNPNIAFVPSTMIAATFVFLFNKYITFGRHEHSFMRQLWRFLAVYTAALLLNVSLAIALHWMGLYYIGAKAIAIGIVAVMNYVLSHSFIFASNDHPKK